MESIIKGGPAFAYIQYVLQPGESLIAESDAMASMSADLDMQAMLNGGLIKGLLRRFLGGESLFINRFTNNSSGTRTLTITQPTPGDIHRVELNGGSICLQPGAYICSTPGVSIGLKWAGFNSLIAREGLFKLIAKGTGTLWYGAYGQMLEKQIDGEFIVDTSHLVAYEPQIKLKTQMAGGLISSFTSGEGFVTRLEGTGKITIQTRSISSLGSWVNRYI